MTRRILAILTVSMIPALSVLGEVVTSEFHADPVTEGWEFFGEFCDPITWVSDGWYNQDLNDDACPGAEDGATEAYTQSAEGFNSSAAWYYEHRVSAASDSTEFAGAAPTVVAAGNFFGVGYNATLASDQVELFRDVALPILFFDVQPGVAHRIRLELRNDLPPTYKWFIDSVLVDEGLAVGPFPANDARVTWVGRSWQLPTINRWDYIRFGDIPTPASGDFDSNGAADSFEVFYFAECLDRSEAGEPANPSCTWADMNADNTVDCSDADLFAAIYTGNPADLNFFQCSPPIPAVSQWGAAMLTLMLAAIGTLAFRPAISSSVSY